MSDLTLKPSRAIKASFYITVYRPYFPRTRGFMMKISLKLFYQYMAIFFNFSPTLSLSSSTTSQEIRGL